MRWQSRNPVSKWIGAEVPAQQRRLERGGPVSGRILSRFDKKGYEILQVPTGQEVLNAGADDYLVRPFSPLGLLDKTIGGFLDNDVQRVNPFKGLQERKI